MFARFGHTSTQFSHTLLQVRQRSFSFTDIFAFFENCFFREAIFFCTRYRSIFYNFFFKDCFYCKLCVADCLYDCSCPFCTVALRDIRSPHLFQNLSVVNFCFAAFVYINSVCFIEFCRYFFTNSYDNRICISSKVSVSVTLARPDASRAPSSIFLQDMPFSQRNRRKEFFKSNTVPQLQQFVFCCRHIVFRSSVYKVNVLNAFCAFCCYCRIHSCVSAADCDHFLPRFTFPSFSLKSLRNSRALIVSPFSSFKVPGFLRRQLQSQRHSLLLLIPVQK